MTWISAKISDSLIQMGHPHGGYIPDLDSFSPRTAQKVFGPAFTVKVHTFKTFRCLN